jgi:type IV secretory pathway VirB10-like protein
MDDDIKDPLKSGEEERPVSQEVGNTDESVNETFESLAAEDQAEENKTPQEEYQNTTLPDSDDAGLNDEKISAQDASLSLIRKPLINKKMLKLLSFGFATLVGGAVIIGLSPPSKPKPQQPKDSAVSNSLEKPNDLAIDESDYLSPEAKRAKNYQPTQAEKQNAKVVGDNKGGMYRTYGNNGRNVEATNPPPQQGGNLSAASSPFTQRTVTTEEAAAQSGFFFPFKPLDDNGTPQQTVPTSGSTAQATDAYRIQNMQKEKEDFFNSAQKADYSGYLPNKVIPAMDQSHELKATTIIPILLLTAINSDTPGMTSASVMENVYDSFSGENILIPKGSRVIGRYDSGIAFGQNRVMVSWDRIILPDNSSITIGGMEGADLQGNAGLADKVDHHLDKIMQAVSLATLFDVGKLSAESALSTVSFLKSLSDAVTASGSASSSVESSTQSIVTQYATKILSQQPTITIREGTRSNIIVSKDIILPTSYDANTEYVTTQGE